MGNSLVTVTGAVVTSPADTFPDSILLQNTLHGTSQLFIGQGNKFGELRSTYCKFVVSADAPPSGSYIVNAFLRFEADGNSSGNSIIAVIQNLKKDGRWNLSGTTDIWTKGNTGIQHQDFKVRAMSGSTTLAETFTPRAQGKGISLNANASPGKKKRVSQSFTMGSSSSLCTRIDWGMCRVGTPAGTNNLVVQIFEETSGSGQNDLPVSGSPLAQSSPRNASGINGPCGQYRDYETFNFTGSNIVTLSASTKYVAVLSASYAQSPTNYIDAGHRITFGDYAGGIAASFGNGLEMDDQNYVTEGNVASIPIQGSFGVWSVGTGISPGDIVDSININNLIQNVVSDPNYVRDGIFGLRLVPTTFFNDPGDMVTFASFDHTTRAAPQLIIQYRTKRNVYID